MIKRYGEYTNKKYQEWGICKYCNKHIKGLFKRVEPVGICNSCRSKKADEGVVVDGIRRV